MASPNYENRSLLERIGLGDRQALMVLYDRYAAVIYSVGFRVLREPVGSEQILSDIFLDIWRDPIPFLQMTGSLAPTLCLFSRNAQRAAEHAGTGILVFH